MTNVITNYAEACRARVEIQRKTERTAELIAAVGKALAHDPMTIHIRSAPSSGLKTTVGKLPLLVPAAAWPTSEGLEVLLNAYRDATCEVHRTWAAIPQKQRRFLKPPPAADMPRSSNGSAPQRVDR